MTKKQWYLVLGAILVVVLLWWIIRKRRVPVSGGTMDTTAQDTEHDPGALEPVEPEATGMVRRRTTLI